MLGINKVILVGTVASDIESKQAQNASFIKFRFATVESYKGKDGNMQDSTEWHNIVIFGKLAETVANQAAKGTLAAIEGKIKTNKYTGKDGVDRYATSIIASSFQMPSEKSNQQGSSNRNGNVGNNYNRAQGNGGYSQKPSYNAKKPQANAVHDDEPYLDDDIPF